MSPLDETLTIFVQGYHKFIDSGISRRLAAIDSALAMYSTIFVNGHGYGSERMWAREIASWSTTNGISLPEKRYR